MLASIIYNHGKFCDDFKSTLKLGAYKLCIHQNNILYPNRTHLHIKNPYKTHKYRLCRDFPIYSGNPLYPQKAKSFILTYFLFQGILGLPSRSWLTLAFFSLISRYSSIFKAFSMVLSKRKRPHRTVFPLYKVFIFSLFYSFPRLKIFAP